MTDAYVHDEPRTRSAGLAFVLGLLFGGLALFYVLPPKRALPAALIAYAIVAASGGILWVPVFLAVAFWAARLAKFSERGVAFSGGRTAPGEVGTAPHRSDPTPPSAYVRVR